MKARFEIGPTDRTFASGILLELITAMRRTAPGDLIGITGTAGSLGADLELWSRLTGNAIVGTTSSPEGGTRWVVRNGVAPKMGDDERPVGSRLWLYTNFDCNLACDYCCVRSSPGAARRGLGLSAIRRIAEEAPPLGVREIFVTGGEPMLLPDIAEMLEVCTTAAPTTMLTNGLLLKGPGLDALRTLPRARITLQISLDSPTPPLHDLHRGAGTWRRVWTAVGAARAAGFRVRLAATVSNEADEVAFHDFLEREGIAPHDRVVRRVALRGLASEGVALARADVVPEATLTAEGVYWHPVGADDPDFLVSPDIFPLAAAFEALRASQRQERGVHDALASIFHCA